MTNALSRSAFKGKRVLITAGPTREYLDPVRYLSNASSGKMGLALAQKFKSYGAKVFLVLGPGLPPPKGIPSIPVVSALQMFGEVRKRFPRSDLFVSAAAVSDYRPGSFKAAKIKRNGRPLALKLLPNPDILAAVGKQKGGRFCVGFALETGSTGPSARLRTLSLSKRSPSRAKSRGGNALKEARRKMREKNCDMILLNDPSAMESDFVKASVLSRDGKVLRLGRITKEKCAEELCRAIAARFPG